MERHPVPPPLGCKFFKGDTVASFNPDGSIQTSDGRTIFADDPVTVGEFAELAKLLVPQKTTGGWPFISGGGGGGSNLLAPVGNGAQGVQGAQGPTGPGGGAQGAQGSSGPQGVAGAQGSQGTTGAQGAQGPGLTTDIFAADRVVDPSGAGTDLTLASALAGLPATGGKIYIKAGAYVIPTLALPDKSVEIVGGGVGSTIITGPTGAAFFTSAFDQNRIFRDITFLGDGSAGQIFLSQTVSLTGANKIDIQNIVIPSGSGIEKIFVFAASARLEILDCSIFATATAASRFVDAAASPVIVDVYGTLMGGGGGISGSLVQISAVNSSFTLLNGFVIDSDSTFVACTLNSGLLTLGSDCGLTDCLFINGANISVTGSRVTITGCDFIGGPPTRWIDIVASGATPLNGSITGCLFGAVTSEAVRIAQTGWTVSGNALCTITETGAADGNFYDNNTGSAASTIIGDNSKVNDVLQKKVTGGATVDALTAVFTHTNPKGLTGAGSIKNTGANSLTVRRTGTDGYATTDFQEDVVISGATFAWPMDTALGTALSAFVTFTVSVKSTTPGSPTTYDLRHSSAGAY